MQNSPFHWHVLLDGCSKTLSQNYEDQCNKHPNVPYLPDVTMLVSKIFSTNLALSKIIYNYRYYSPFQLKL